MLTPYQAGSRFMGTSESDLKLRLPIKLTTYRKKISIRGLMNPRFRSNGFFLFTLTFWYYIARTPRDSTYALFIKIIT